MQTPDLSALARDFARRMDDLDWLTDALFLAGMYPSTDPDATATQRTIEEHVILIGPTANRERPFRPVHESMRGDNDWIRVSPHTDDVVDLDLFYNAISTQPRSNGDGKDVNILIVHYTRRAADGPLMKCFMAHHEEMDLPGASGKLADDEWVHNTFSLWLDDGQPPKPRQTPAPAPERVQVHRALIKSHCRYLRRMWESPSVDLMIETPGLERHRAAAVVSEALGDHPEVELVYPTSLGTYIFIAEARSWPAVVDHLVEGLNRLDQAAVVTAPPARELWAGPAPVGCSVTAMMAYPMELPFAAVPRNPYGVAIHQWGVSWADTERLLDAAARWVSQAGPYGQTGGSGPIIPVSAEDAAELVRLRLEDGQHRVGLTFRDTKAGRARIIGASEFGQVAYSDIDDSAGPGVIEQALGLSNMIRVEAARIEVAMIIPLGTSGPVTTLDLPGGGGLWSHNRHLWSSRVHDVYGIQLLTNQHLEHARDLSDWHVEKVGDRRWLVTARDLQPWYGFTNDREWHMRVHPDNAQDFVVQARHDFGTMRLTQEIADAHPA